MVTIFCWSFRETHDVRDESGGVEGCGGDSGLVGKANHDELTEQGDKVFS